MKASISHIAQLRFPFLYLRQVTVYSLLFLLSLSFIVEHIPFMEGDVLELVENSEKEEIKDNKLISNVLCSISPHFGLKSSEQFNGPNDCSINGVYLDVSTPPPRQV